MPYASQTFLGHQEDKLEGVREHASAAQFMAGETLQGAFQRQFMAVIAVDVHLCRSGCFLQYHTENSSV